MINILISVNSSYLDKAQTMLFSMRMHTEEDITVYLLDHRLSTEEKNGFGQYLKEKCQMQLVVINVRKTALDDFPVGTFSVEMYFRILAQFVLPETLDRILWLDADIILLKDISEFYYQSFENNKYVVCADNLKGHNPEVLLKRLELPEKHTYFNSGVMLMNLELLRRDTNMHDILKQCNLLRDRLRFPDQDILNCIYQGQVKYAEKEKYNYQLASIKHIPDADVSNIVILHYCGSRKPWNYWQITSASKYYWRVRRQQGENAAANKAYLLKILGLPVECWRKLKDILF